MYFDFFILHSLVCNLLTMTKVTRDAKCCDNERTVGNFQSVPGAYLEFTTIGYNGFSMQLQLTLHFSYSKYMQPLKNKMQVYLKGVLSTSLFVCLMFIHLESCNLGKSEYWLLLY